MLERSVSQDFVTSIFYDSNPSGYLTNRLKYFQITFPLRRNISNCGVHPTKESMFVVVHHSAETISVVCITLQRQFPWCALLCRDNIRGVHHSAETISVVCITLQRPYPWSASLCRDNIRGEHNTAETISMECITLQRQYPWCA